MVVSDISMKTFDWFGQSVSLAIHTRLCTTAQLAFIHFSCLYSYVNIFTLIMTITLVYCTHAFPNACFFISRVASIWATICRPKAFSKTKEFPTPRTHRSTTTWSSKPMTMRITPRSTALPMILLGNSVYCLYTYSKKTRTRHRLVFFPPRVFRWS